MGVRGDDRKRGGKDTKTKKGTGKRREGRDRKMKGREENNIDKLKERKG